MRADREVTRIAVALVEGRPVSRLDRDYLRKYAPPPSSLDDKISDLDARLPQPKTEGVSRKELADICRGIAFNRRVDRRLRHLDHEMEMLNAKLTISEMVQQLGLGDFKNG
jgi:hypothetical protein